MKSAFIPLALLFLVLASCKTTPNQSDLQFDKAPLFGMIYDLDNKACSGVDLILDGTQSTTSDIKGRFFLSDVKQGTHTIRAAEADHETLEVTFKFENRTQVLYLKMVSFDQLLSQAQDALDRRNWAESESLLKRAAAIHSANVVLVYLQSILDYQRADYAHAAVRLESLLASGVTISYVYLFLADLYQYHLGKPELAQKALVDYLKQTDNPDVRKRLDEMRAASK